MNPFQLRAVVLLGLLLSTFLSFGQGDVSEIIRKSVEANQRDWDADPQFDYTETDLDKGVRKTYSVTMLYGTPYERLVAINGRKLNPALNRQEQKKYDDVVAQRRAETPEQKSARIAKFDEDRKRDHTMLEQLTVAFDFTLLGRRVLNNRRVYVLQAKPKKNYRPPNRDSEVLPGMEGKLWIDQESFQWVKVEAHVMHPVRIEGILAEVEPGTRFEVEKKPVTHDIWLTSHFAMMSTAKVMMLVPHRSQEDVTYVDYHKSASPE